MSLNRETSVRKTRSRTVINSPSLVFSERPKLRWVTKNDFSFKDTVRTEKIWEGVKGLRQSL